MLSRFYLRAFALSLALVVTFSVNAHANIVTGSLWKNPLALDATPANVATLGTPVVTFSAPSNPLNFSSYSGGGTSGDPSAFYTIGPWLAGGGATGVNYSGGATSGDTMDNTMLQFLGTVSLTNGESFNVTHDDGLTLIIGGVKVVDAPGPTAPAVTPFTWTGASGNYSFELDYAEVDGAPAVLIVDLPLSSTPEPSTLIVWSLLGSLAIGLGWWRKRKAS